MTAKRRISIELRRWPLRLTFGVRPTIVIDGRTEPAQWGVGTWLVPADRPVEVTVFMFVAGIRSVSPLAPWGQWMPGSPIAHRSLHSAEVISDDNPSTADHHCPHPLGKYGFITLAIYIDGVDQEARWGLASGMSRQIDRSWSP